MMNIVLTLALITLGATHAWGADREDSTRRAAARTAEQVCATCHGNGGETASPVIPRLAGQSKDFMVSRLNVFKAAYRAASVQAAAREHDFSAMHGYMWGMAVMLEDPMINALADYFAAQRPVPGKAGDPARIARGKQLYYSGLPQSNVAPCASCHGDDAHGLSVFPRLASQNAAYLVRQITLIKNNKRNVSVMHVQALSNEDINAIAAFLQAL